MTKLFLVSGYDSYNQKQITRVFSTPSEAEQFKNGLTDSKFQVLTGETNIKAFNKYLCQLD